MTQPLCTLFVATDLRSLVGDFLLDSEREVLVDGRLHRRLDPNYFAWLRHQMQLAKTACNCGKLSRVAFDELRNRFNAIQDQALEAFGESALLDAVERLDPKAYSAPGKSTPAHAVNPPAKIPEAPVEPRPPHAGPVASPMPSQAFEGHRVHSFPKEALPGCPFNHPVTAEAKAMVDSIRESALAAGWTEAELYQTRGRFAFPCGGDYGVVCFIHPGQRLGQVTSQTIQLICKAGHSLHFYRRTAA